MSNTNKVLKSGIWYTISSVAIRAVAIITTPIYTSMLTPDDYGIANTFNFWIEMFNIITCLCVVYSIGRAKIDFKEKFDEYMSALQGLSSSFAFLVLIFAFIFRDTISVLIKYEVPLVIVLFVYLCVYPSVEYMLQKCRYEYKYKENISISLITCFGTIIFSVALILLFNDKRYFGKIIGSILPTFLLGVFFYFKILLKGKTFFKKEYWVYALKFGLPMIPHALALVALAQIDRIMIRDLKGDAAVGLYTFGYSFATLLAIFTNAIGQAWLPWFNEQLDAGNKDKIKDIQKKLVLLGIFLTIGFITVAPEALMILSPRAKAYWVAKWVIPPVALGTLAQYFYTNYVNIELFYKKTPIIAASSIVAAVVNCILNAIAIPRFGYISAAYTTLISYLFLMLFHYIATRFVLKAKVYSDSFMFLGCLFAIVLGLSVMAFYGDGIQIALMRYGFAIIVLGIFAFIRRNDIIILYKYILEKYVHKASASK
ncbi:MAG: oligosaccharide flippase family protein [Lachnospiraceae bacterium]|nr:oligosaccharide flippase family protein [Lachnospiraceae bacterium]